MNQVNLIGRLVADPELKQTPTGVSVTTFRIAVNHRYNPKDSERKAYFFDIIAWRRQAEFITQYFKKGNQILLEDCELTNRSYTDKNEIKRTFTEIVAGRCSFVGSKGSNGNAAGSDRGGNGKASTQAPAYSDGDADDFAPIDDDGDLPF